MVDMRPIHKHHIKLALGGMRFDRMLDVGWQITPSIGIVAKDIARMGLELESFKEPLTRSVITVMLPSIRKNFEKGGRPDKWEKLAPYTLQQKGKLGIANGDLPLHRTGALKRGATQFSIWDIGDNSATVRKLPDRIWYGAIHQAGYGGFGVYLSAARRKLGPGASKAKVTRLAEAMLDAKLLKVEKAVKAGDLSARKDLAKGQGIPQRRFILFQEEDIDDIQQVFYEWLVQVTIEQGRFTE